MDKQKVYLDLQSIIPKENIKLDEPMSRHTSFKTGGPVDLFVVVKNEEQIKKVLQYAKENNIDLYIMGNGSNLLVKDNGYRGIILKIELEDFKKRTVPKQKKLSSDEKGCTKNKIIVTCGAGEKIMAFAQTLKRFEITGFEELSGIPGTIGGANVMNAGAYGKELKDILVETKALNKETGKIEILKKEQQQLEYRNSIFKQNQYIILEIKLELQKGNKEEIENKMQEILEQRKEKQPLEYPSAGSTFKRGENYITAKLIDECGLKGYSIGGAQISEKHAGFIINKENAKSKDIIDLIEYTKRKVLEKFGVKIQEEIEIIGED